MKMRFFFAMIVQETSLNGLVIYCKNSLNRTCSFHIPIITEAYSSRANRFTFFCYLFSFRFPASTSLDTARLSIQFAVQHDRAKRQR